MPAKNWRNYVVERLRQHPDEIPAYLNQSLADDASFLVALKTAVEARFGGASALARVVGLHRVSIQNMLSGHGNPRFDSLQRVLHALGVRLSVVETGTSARIDFDREQIVATAPDCAGVYYLADGRGEVRYVGSTGESIRRRLLQHLEAQDEPARTARAFGFDVCAEPTRRAAEIVARLAASQHAPPASLQAG